MRAATTNHSRWPGITAWAISPKTLAATASCGVSIVRKTERS
ncbi:Uncharacterised protein [Mycobacteroides abscessus subsp. abscessus]|nr:Uncharacterised protein [Mycobacteroides abscessus subsp. abscessus]